MHALLFLASVVLGGSLAMVVEVEIAEVTDSSCLVEVTARNASNATVRATLENLMVQTENIAKTAISVPASIPFYGLIPNTFYGLFVYGSTTGDIFTKDIAMKAGKRLTLDDVVSTHTEWQAETVLKVTATSKLPRPLRLIYRFSVDCPDPSHRRDHSFVLSKNDHEKATDECVIVLGPLTARVRCTVFMERAWIQSTAVGVSDTIYLVGDRTGAFPTIATPFATTVYNLGITTVSTKATELPKYKETLAVTASNAHKPLKLRNGEPRRRKTLERSTCAWLLSVVVALQSWSTV